MPLNSFGLFESLLLHLLRNRVHFPHVSFLTNQFFLSESTLSCLIKEKKLQPKWTTLLRLHSLIRLKCELIYIINLFEISLIYLHAFIIQLRILSSNCIFSISFIGKTFVNIYYILNYTTYKEIGTRPNNKNPYAHHRQINLKYSRNCSICKKKNRYNLFFWFKRTL